MHFPLLISCLITGLIAASPAFPYTLSPAPGSKVPCDTPLRIAFTAEPVAGRSGALRVREANGALVYSLDFSRLASASGATFRARIGNDSLNIRPLIIADREAYFRLPAGALLPGTSYTAELDAGALVDSVGKPQPGIAWAFSTAARPASGRTAYTVAAAGDADFRTVQGAMESLPQGNAPVTLAIGPGIYREILRSEDRGGVTLAGSGRDACIIRSANNEAFNPGTTARALARLYGDDLVLRDLTFVNETPRGGTQAEALFLRGRRCVIRNCVFRSFQDTMLLEGSVYVAGSRIEGAVDYIWGTGAAFFRSCELFSNADGYIVEARNPKGSAGYAFVGCTLSAASGVVRGYLARDQNGDFPYGNVWYIDCVLGAHVPAAGWLVSPVAGAVPGFAEYGSVDAAGKAIDTGKRAAFSRRLAAAEAARLRNPVEVVGGPERWDPEAAIGIGAWRAMAGPLAVSVSGSAAAKRVGYDPLGRLRRKAQAAAR